MALTQDQKNKLGICLARLVPGFDGQVLAYKDHEIVWRDARPQPDESAIVGMYNTILAEESAKAQERSDLDALKATLVNLKDDIKNATTIGQVKAILVDILKLMYLQNKG
jgi:hypothetical protein